MFSRYAIGFLLLALAEIGFGLTFVVGSVLTKDCGVSADVLAFCRFTLAGGALVALQAVTRRGRAALLRPTRRDWLQLLWIAPVGTSVMAVCVFIGCSRVSVANASMADALTPLMIFLAAAVISRHITPGELVGLLSGFLGAVLVVQIITPAGLALEAYTIGDFFILLAAATWGVYTVCGTPLIHRLGSTVFSSWTMVIGAILLAAALPFFDSHWPHGLRAWLLVSALAFASTLMPFWAWNAAQKFLPISIISVSAYFAPIVAMGLGVLLLHEAVTPLQWLGTLFIVASACVETGRVRRQSPV